MKCKKPKMAEGGFLARSALKRGMKNTSPAGAARMGQMLDEDNRRRAVRGEPKTKMAEGGMVKMKRK